MYILDKVAVDHDGGRAELRAAFAAAYSVQVVFYLIVAPWRSRIGRVEETAPQRAAESLAHWTASRASPASRATRG